MGRANRLVEVWREFNTAGPPYVLQGDDLHPKDIVKYETFDDYISSDEFGNKHDMKLHVGLLPLPYAGDLKRASVFVLTLNPGLSAVDYFAEKGMESYRSMLVRNLRQENLDDEFPNLFLNPKFSWTSGFEYWDGKFSEIASKVVEKRCITYREALSYLSQQVAWLELIPYHSRESDLSKPVENLESTNEAVIFAKSVLQPMAEKKEAVVVVTRGKDHWGLRKHEKVVLYERGESRGASLTLESRGGRAIARHLGLL